MKASLPYKYITSVKNGKYYVVFDYKDTNGKRKRKWVKTNLPEKSTKKALNAKVKELAEEFGREYFGETAVSAQISAEGASVISVPSGEMSADKFFDLWLGAIKPDVARTTHMTYKTIKKGFMSFIDENYPDIKLAEITHSIIQEYLNEKLKNGCKGSSIKQNYLGLHSAFAYAVKMEYLTVHPMDKLNVPRADRHEATFYNQEELNELFEVFKDDELELVVHIAAYYGLRRCEILGLRWDAIDFQNKTITIQRKVVQVEDENGKEQIFVETRLKTNSTRRTLPLIPHIEKMLLEKKKLDAHNRKIYGKSYDTEYEGFICRATNGSLIKPNQVTSRFHYVIKKNGLRPLRFHDLRHSCASLLLANDIPMKAIQEWLGHSNFSITANLYSHLEYNAKIASAETIARVLGGGATGSESGAEVTKPKKAKTKEEIPADTLQANSSTV